MLHTWHLLTSFPGTFVLPVVWQTGSQGFQSFVHNSWTFVCHDLESNLIDTFKIRLNLRFFLIPTVRIRNGQTNSWHSQVKSRKAHPCPSLNLWRSPSYEAHYQGRCKFMQLALKRAYLDFDLQIRKRKRANYCYRSSGFWVNRGHM